mgnify:CR=1 FL=1|tara:strand:+ start:2811 stop:3098 length:288 start_codon:yes stop_codon:yes gene_type:complete
MKVGEKVHFDGEDKFVIQNTYDNNPYIEEAKQLRESGVGQTGDKRLVGRVPMHIVSMWLKEAGVRWDDHEAKKQIIRKKLLSGDFAAFRVWEGTY